MNTNNQNRIKELRKKNHVTQIELANEIEVSPQVISKYEKGERYPKIDKWKKMAKFFGVSVPFIQGVDDVSYDHKSWDFSKIYKDPPAHGLSGMADDNNLPLTISSQSLFSMLYMAYSNRAYGNPDAKFADTNEKIRELNKSQKEQVIKSFISWFENEIDRSKDID